MANYALAPLAVVLASVVAGVAAQPPYSDVNELGLDINGAWECPCLTRQHPGVEEVSKRMSPKAFLSCTDWLDVKRTMPLQTVQRTRRRPDARGASAQKVPTKMS